MFRRVQACLGMRERAPSVHYIRNTHRKYSYFSTTKTAAPTRVCVDELIKLMRENLRGNSSKNNNKINQPIITERIIRV